VTVAVVPFDPYAVEGGHVIYIVARNHAVGRERRSRLPAAQYGSAVVITNHIHVRGVQFDATRDEVIYDSFPERHHERMTLERELELARFPKP